MLPSRRVELYLAQIAMQVAQLRGAQNVSLEDFMFDPGDAGGEDEPTAEEEAAFFDFKPRKRGGE